MLRDQPSPPLRSGLRIGAVDDHPVILAGVSEGLRWHLSGSVVTPVTRSVDFFLAAAPTVDVVLLDIELHDGTDPADNVRRLTAKGWPVLLFTQDPRMHLVSRTFRAGAQGILSKGEDLTTIAYAVNLVASGTPYLSPEWAVAVAQDEAWTAPNLAPREVEAVRLYAAGMKLTSVARRLGVSEDTARTYLLRARHKYAEAGRPANTKTDLYIRAVEDGILPTPGTVVDG
ncbi:MAG: response regulator transcription factor [Propionibacteriaceae bacterium]|nr:response regulator transcription factor [Propionibacteriaceae bacterium]